MRIISISFTLILYFFLLMFIDVPVSAYTETTPSIEALRYQVGYDTFSPLLQAQTAIFTVIVGLFLGASYFYQKKVNKDEIQKEVANQKPEFIALIDAQMHTSIQRVDTKLSDVDTQIEELRGQVYRSMGLIWDGQKDYSTALVWWVRACSSFSKAGKAKLTRICLQYARESVSKVPYGAFIDADTSGEIQALLKDIDDELYKAEKELFFEALKETMKKEFKSTFVEEESNG